MKIGKVSQSVLKRSMLKPLQYTRQEAMFAPSVEEMCYGIKCKEDEQILCASTVLYGNEKDLGVFALAQTINHLATRGAKTVGVSVHIMLPPHAYESRLKAMMEHLELAGSTHEVQILNAKAEVSSAVSKAVVIVNGIGIVKKENFILTSQGTAGLDIVHLKWIGLEGSLRAVNEKEQDLKERFVPSFLNKIKDMGAQIFSEKEIEIALHHGAKAMQQITEGGILATLWEMAEASIVGLEVELKKIAIRQETIEICEFCHLNPYQLTSAGSVVIFTEQGEELVQKYAEAGICASVIGRTTANSERVILGGEEKRFLDRPATDELLKIYD